MLFMQQCFSHVMVCLGAEWHLTSNQSHFAHRVTLITPINLTQSILF